jgi:P27 family predicted phage terminase small subunit
MSSDGRLKENKPKKRDIMTSDGAYTRKDRRDNRMSSSADLTKFEPPEWLDDPGLRIWGKFADLVYRAGVSTEMDYFSFEAMVLNYRELRKLQRDVAINGYTDDYTGKARPEVAAMQSTLRVHLEILKSYGMTPKARGVVAIPKGEMDKRPKEGEEVKAEGFGAFKVTEGGVNRHEQRYNDRKRKTGGA